MSAIIVIIISLAVMTYNSMYHIQIKNSIKLKHFYATISTDFICDTYIDSVKPISHNKISRISTINQIAPHNGD